MCANFARASARRSGRCAGGNSPSYGWYRFSTCRAIVTLCTSVGPSAMPMIGAANHMPANGISFDTPSAP